LICRNGQTPAASFDHLVTGEATLQKYRRERLDQSLIDLLNCLYDLVAMIAHGQKGFLEGLQGLLRNARVLTIAPKLFDHFYLLRNGPLSLSDAHVGL
jgi:hypothetical protein